MYKCIFCNRETNTKSSNSQHILRCQLNPNKLIGWVNPTKGKKHSETTKSKMSASQKALSDDILKKRTVRMVERNKNYEWNEDAKRNHSNIMKQVVINNPDSYTKNNVCGRTKFVEYNGVKLKGSWELKVAKWLDANGIAWQSEVNPQPYFWNNSWHLYYPDFYLPKTDEYIEVKGYKTVRDSEKWKQFKGKLFIIDKNNINSLEKIQLQTGGQATILGS